MRKRRKFLAQNRVSLWVRKATLGIFHSSWALFGMDWLCLGTFRVSYWLRKLTFQNLERFVSFRPVKSVSWTQSRANLSTKSHFKFFFTGFGSTFLGGLKALWVSERNRKRKFENFDRFVSFLAPRIASLGRKATLTRLFCISAQNIWSTGPIAHNINAFAAVGSSPASMECGNRSIMFEKVH